MHFLQVIKMREFLLQRKNFKYTFTAYSTSKQIENKNSIVVPDIEIQLPLEYQIRPGDRVEVTGAFKGGVQSLFKPRLILTVQSIRMIPTQRPYVFSSFFFFLRQLEEFPREVGTRLLGILTPPQAALLVGIVFGGSNSLPKSLLEDAKVTGLIHVTAASGYNVALLVGFSLTFFTRLVHRRIAALFCLITVFSYSCMAGFSPPILRAALMSALYLLAIYTGRLYVARWSLWVSAVLMLIYQPFLIFSPSFLLSCSATAGVLYQSIFFKRRDKRENTAGILREVWSTLEENYQTTVSVLIFTLPILIYFFGSFSLVSIVSNTVLLWIVGPLMYAGLLVSIIVFMPGPLGALMGMGLSLALEVFIRSIHLFAQFPWASIEVTSPSIVGVIGYYLCLGGYILWRIAKEDKEC